MTRFLSRTPSPESSLKALETKSYLNRAPSYFFYRLIFQKAAVAKVLHADMLLFFLLVFLVQLKRGLLQGLFSSRVSRK